MIVKTLNNLLTITALSLLIGGFVIFWDSTPSYKLQNNHRKLPDANAQAESYMNAVETKKYSTTGQKDFILNADRSLFFRKGNFYQLSNPNIVAYNEKQSDEPWQIKAKKGLVYENGNRVVFQNNVEMWQALSSGRSNRLTTPQLTIYPQKKLVESSKWVNIVAPDGVTKGKGMKANLEQQTVSLLSQVKGVYVGQ